MFEEPLFQNNILSQTGSYFHHYLTFQNWAVQYLIAIIGLYILYKVLMYKNPAAYPRFFPSEKYKFSLTAFSDKLSFLFFFLCFCLYLFNLYNQELSFFANYDTMCAYTMTALKKGITPLWGNNGRLSPVAFWDVNVIYALTHNFKIINIYIIGQMTLILWLLNKLLCFMTIPHRFICMGLIIILPSVLGTNLISYPERMLLIYFLSSLICLQKYGENPRAASYLWFGIFFMNLAIYTKESAILLYFGILVYSFFLNLWQEKIKLKSFLHPFRSARQFPMEMLMFASMIIFAGFYLQNVYAITDSQYMSIRKGSITTLLWIYKLDIFIIVTALLCGLYARSRNFIPNGLLTGTIWSCFFIIFILHLTPPPDKVYYLFLPAVTALIFIFCVLKSRMAVTALTIVFTLAFLHQDIRMNNAEDGKEIRQVSEFLLSQPEPLSVFISEYSEIYPWWASCWSVAYKYYAPDKNIKFATSSFNHNRQDIPFLAYWARHPETYHPIKHLQYPQSGDFYLIKKTTMFEHDKTVIKDISHELAYSNKRFEVYRIK